MRKKTRPTGRENSSQQNSRHPTNIWSLWKTALLGGRGWMSLQTGPLTSHKCRRCWKFQDKGRTPTTCSHIGWVRAQTARSEQRESEQLPLFKYWCSLEQNVKRTKQAPNTQTRRLLKALPTHLFLLPLAARSAAAINTCPAAVAGRVK